MQPRSAYFKPDVPGPKKIENTDCIICGERLSDDEIKAKVAMGREICGCWDMWLKHMKALEEEGVPNKKRDKIAIAKIKKRQMERHANSTC